MQRQSEVGRIAWGNPTDQSCLRESRITLRTSASSTEARWTTTWHQRNNRRGTQDTDPQVSPVGRWEKSSRDSRFLEVYVHRRNRKRSGRWRKLRQQALRFRRQKEAGKGEGIRDWPYSHLWAHATNMMKLLLNRATTVLHESMMRVEGGDLHWRLLRWCCRLAPEARLKAKLWVSRRTVVIDSCLLTARKEGKGRFIL